MYKCKDCGYVYCIMGPACYDCDEEHYYRHQRWALPSITVEKYGANVTLTKPEPKLCRKCEETFFDYSRHNCGVRAKDVTEVMDNIKWKS